METELRKVVVLGHNDKEQLDGLVKNLVAVKDGDCMNKEDAKIYIDEVVNYLKSLNSEID